MTERTDLRFRIRPERLALDRRLWPPRREIPPRAIAGVFFSHYVAFSVSGVEMFGDEDDPTSLYPLLAITVFMRHSLHKSSELGFAEFAPMTGNDPTFFRALPDGYVEVTGLDGAVAVAKREEIEQAMDRFDASVREFLLAEFPDLREHSAYGWWFRGESPPPDFFE